MRNGAPSAQHKRFLSCLGGLFGIAFTSWVAHLAVGQGISMPLLVAPMGASAVLLFAVPESPLAQPWSIMGGNIVAATVGVTCAQWIDTPVFAAAVAVALAICAMLALRCVHPPSGAVALTAVLGGPAIHDLGYRFVVMPIALQSAALLTAALVYHRATGHRYPRLHEHDPGVLMRAFDWLRAQLVRRGDEWKEQGQHLLDTASAAESRAFGTLLQEIAPGMAGNGYDELTCAQIMSAAPPAAAMEASSKTDRACKVHGSTPISELAPHFKDHCCEHVWVVDAGGRVIGKVSQLDLIWGLYRQVRSPQQVAA